MLKSFLRRLPPAAAAWSAYRSAQLHREYEERRERYALAASKLGLAYSEAETVCAVRARLAARGAAAVRRALGEIHTFAFIPSHSWHEELLPDLEALGRVTRFDYAREGYEVRDFSRADRDGIAARAAMNELVLPALRAAQAVQPVDWVFVYASGIEISASTLRRITDETGIPTVGMCLDDKHSWTGPFMGDHRGGQVDIASAFDVSWTSARVACEWYLAESGRPLYMPEGFDATRYHPLKVEKDLPVSFVGGAYGRRPSTIRRLRGHGVDVRVFGDGWRGSEPAASLNEVANRSIVNLGMGEIGHSDRLTNVKGRDFQIPGAGGGAYLTSFNADLAQHFEVGREILCYRNEEDLVEQLRDWTKRPEEAELLAARARARCLVEHRWLHRYRRVLQTLGALEEGPEAA